MRFKDTCIIFDLDGTLVDSETLCNQAFIDLLPDIIDPVEQLVHRYRGKRFADIVNDLEGRIGKQIPNAFEALYRKRVAELFDQSLKPIPGVLNMLENLRRPTCIASSGPMHKIKQALKVSGLETYFDSSLFSSYTIGSWKPEPDLFLHAACAMGFSPNKCIVIEDSEIGIQAADAAGMVALQYAPHYSKKGKCRANVFTEMTALPGLIRTIEVALQTRTHPRYMC